MSASIPFPTKPIAFVTHYMLRRPFGHLALLALVIGGAAAAIGVQYAMKLLIDAMGSVDGDDENLKRLAKAGVEVNTYCKPHWWNLRRFNHRTHRKLLIVDGLIGYTFGHGIADQWLGHGQDEKHWRDTAVRVEGPAVQALQSVFMENWIEESHCVPAG